MIYRQEVRPFTDKQIGLLQNFAAQAVIAMENARLLTETREALEQQTATAEVLQVINSSPGDLGPVFDAMLEKAMTLCNAGFGILWTYDGVNIQAAAVRGAPASYASFLTGAPHPPGQLIARLARGEPFVHENAVDSQGYRDGEPLARAFVELAGGRTRLGVPLRKDAAIIGLIVLYRQEVQPFTDNQIALVQNFAAQAVIAIENARLLSELRQRTADLGESLEQQTATSEVLRVISSSPSELESVFQAMLVNAMHICKAEFGHLLLYDGECYRAAYLHNLPPAYRRFWEQGPVRVSTKLALGRLPQTKEVIQITDMKADRAYGEGDPLRVATVDLGGAQTLLCVPMLKENHLVGAIAIYRQELLPFTDKQIELVKNFAAQAVIAIENARLLSELRESLEQQTATSEVLRVISSSPGELQPVFEAMLENAVRICEARFGTLQLRETDGFRVAAMHNPPPAFAEARRANPLIYPSAQNALGRVVATKQPVHIADYTTELAYKQRDPAAVGLVELAGARTFVVVPMLKEGELIGNLVVYRQEVRPFTDKQIALLQNFAAQAVIAIENARLLNELRQRTTDLSESLEQQTATSEVLKVISSAQGELQPVFDAILENATRICEANFGNLILYDGEIFRRVALHNAPPAWAIFDGSNFHHTAMHNPPPQFAMQLGGAFRPHPESALGYVARTKQIAHIDDIRTRRPYREGDKTVVALADLAGARTVLVVPMLNEDKLTGVISIYRQEVRLFSDKQIELVKNFAAQAVIAIENARLLSELRQRTDELGRSVGELRALGEVSRVVNSTLELQTVLSTIVAKAVELSGTEAGAIYVFDAAKREFHLRSTHGMDQELIDALSNQHIGLDDPNVAPVFEQREAIQVADLRDEVPSDINEITLRAGFRARLVAPLLRGDDVVGLIVVRRRTHGAFPQNTVDLIKTFAAQSAVAIENARLFKNVDTSLKELRTAQDRLVQTQKLASLGQLTAGIAHEIKNPLNFVNNFSGISAELIDELQDIVNRGSFDEKARDDIFQLTGTLRGNLERIVQHGKRADSIVKNMLLHSRQGSGEHRPVDINALVEESLNLTYHGARAEKQGFNITLERSFDPAAGQIDVFPQEITRVLLNLISNGFYAAAKRREQTGGDGYEATLTAATRSLGDRVEIRIRDNGNGIPSEVREKIFNPFFTTKPAGEGTGLGLSISHDIIVKQHGGSIEVETRPGEFTEFRIVLPRKAA
jgi:GAF domain-containing protein